MSCNFPFHCETSWIAIIRILLPYRTDRSSLPVTTSGFLGCTARAQSSPSQWPCMINIGLSLSLTITSNISLSCVPAKSRSAFQHTLRMDKPGKEMNSHKKAIINNHNSIYTRHNAICLNFIVFNGRELSMDITVSHWKAWNFNFLLLAGLLL